MMQLVSSCLVGMCATWRAAANASAEPAANPLAELLRRGEAIPMCPEQMGGLPTPRPPAEIVGGTGGDVLDGRARVLTRDGADVTANYLRGAHEALKLAQAVGAHRAILKERSPSCASRHHYDGTFSSCLVEGEGVTTALLRRHGIEVVSDEDWLAALAPAPAAL